MNFSLSCLLRPKQDISNHGPRLSMLLSTYFRSLNGGEKKAVFLEAAEIYNNWLTNGQYDCMSKSNVRERVDLYIRHMKLVRKLYEKKILKSDVASYDKTVAQITDNMFRLYGSEHATPNSHYSRHWSTVISRFGVPSGYSTYPFEHFIGTAKRWKDNKTNGKSIGFSLPLIFSHERISKSLVCCNDQATT